MEPIYKRVLIKISGEALAGSNKTGFDFDFVTKVCETVKRCTEMGVEVGIVIGAGNFWRGVKDGAGKVERVSADKMGMLGTAMNCLAVADVFDAVSAKRCYRDAPPPRYRLRSTFRASARDTTPPLPCESSKREA